MTKSKPGLSSAIFRGALYGAAAGVAYALIIGVVYVSIDFSSHFDMTILLTDLFAFWIYGILFGGGLGVLAGSAIAFAIYMIWKVLLDSRIDIHWVALAVGLVCTLVTLGIGYFSGMFDFASPPGDSRRLLDYALLLVVPSVYMTLTSIMVARKFVAEVEGPEKDITAHF